MEALKRLARNFIALDVDRIMFKTMTDNPILEKLAIQLNQTRQLKFGLTANNDFLGDYSAGSVEHYGKSPGPIQLHDTGEFYDSFEVVLQDDGFFIDAEGQKDDTNLFTEYGQDITGLNDENLTIFIGRLIPLVQRTIIKMMFRNVF